MLGQIGVQVGHAGPGDLEGLAAHLAEHEGQHRHQRQQGKGAARHGRIERQHHRGQADDLDRVLEQLHQDVCEDIVDGVHVVGHARDDLTHGRDVEKAHRELFHMGEEIVAQSLDDLLAGALHQPELGPVADEEDQQGRDVGHGHDDDALKAPAGLFPGQEAVVGGAGDVAVDGVADQQRAQQVQGRDDQDEEEAQRQGPDVGAHVAQQAEQGVALVVDVPDCLPLVLTAEDAALLFVSHGNHRPLRAAAFQAAACRRCRGRCRPGPAAPRACRIRPGARPPARRCDPRAGWWRRGAR